MACLRGQTPNGRLGVVQCDEEGCEFRRITDCLAGVLVEGASEGDCVLQLRLRAGDSPVSGDLGCTGEWADPDQIFRIPQPVEAIREWQRHELLIQKFEQQDADARAIEAGVDPTSIGPIAHDPGEKWDASKGANPETCRHWVLRKYTGYLKYNWVCWSCATAFKELPFERKPEEYRYEPMFDTWEFNGRRD